MIYRVFCLILGLAAYINVNGQDSTSFSWGLGFDNSITATSAQTALMGEFYFGRWRAEVGPHLVTSHTFRPEKGPFGGRLVIGYEVAKTRSGKLANVLALDTRMSFYKIGSPPGPDGKLNTFEVLLTSRYDWFFADRWYLNAGIGLGSFTERYKIEGDEDDVFRQLNHLFMIGVSYQFK